MTSNYHERNHWVGTAAEMALCTPVNPAAIWFQTDTLDSYWWDGASWNAMGGGGAPSCFVCDVTNSYGGDGAFDSHTTADYSTVVGYNAGTAITTGRWNSILGAEAVDSGNPSDTVAVGYRALRVVTGARNIAIGSSVMTATTTGYENIGIGKESLVSNIDGYRNVAIGNNALCTSVSSSGNVAIGVSSLYYNLSGHENVGVGEMSLFYNYDGSHNVAIGVEANPEHGSGDYNVSIGYRVMENTETGDWNVAVGAFALADIALGDENTAIGSEALEYLTATGKDIDDFSDYSGTVAGTVRVNSPGHGLAAGVTANIRISNSINYDGVVSVTRIDVDYFYFTHAWLGNDSVTNYCWWSKDLEARYNTSVGGSSGFELETGSQNTYLGWRSGYDGAQAADCDNSMALGANSYTTKSNQVVIGDGNIVETLLKGIVGINEATVAAQLDVAQTNAGGAIPVLELHQSDQDETFINFVGTSSADQTKSISTINGDGAVTGPKNFSASAGWEYVGMVKIDINGSAYWMPYYQPDVA